MINKEIHIITTEDLFKLCESIFYSAESGQLKYIDTEYVIKSLNEVLQDEH